MTAREKKSGGRTSRLQVDISKKHLTIMTKCLRLFTHPSRSMLIFLKNFMKTRGDRKGRRGDGEDVERQLYLTIIFLRRGRVHTVSRFYFLPSRC